MFSVAISPLIFCPGGGEFKLMRFSVDNSFWLMGESRLAAEVLSPGGAWEEHSEQAASVWGTEPELALLCGLFLLYLFLSSLRIVYCILRLVNGVYKNTMSCSFTCLWPLFTPSPSSLQLHQSPVPLHQLYT